MKYAALLRGINVGGKNKLPMKDLAELFAAAGCRNVETYIQSGNVVFDAPASVARRVPQAISKAIEQQFGYRVPLVLRSGAELARVVAENPFLRQGAAEKELHVYFLADWPAEAELDANRSEPDEFILSGRQIYLRLRSNGNRLNVILIKWRACSGADLDEL